MHLDHDDRNIGVNILDRLMEVLAYDHAGACPDDPDALWVPEVDHLLEHRREQFAPAKNKIGVVHCCRDHPQIILLKEAGVLERAARGSVQDRNIGIQIAQCVQRSNNRTRARVHYPDIVHYAQSWCLWY